MPREDGLRAGISHRFSSTNQPEKRGRLPSKLKKFCKDNSISKADVDMVFKNLIFGKTIEELQEMIKPGQKEKLPVIVVLLICAFIHDMQNGTLKEVNTVLDRVWGKPAQQIDLTVPRASIPDTPEERARLMEILESEINLTKSVPKETTTVIVPAISEKPKGEDASNEQRHT